jgi:hypothetical protein
MLYFTTPSVVDGHPILGVQKAQKQSEGPDKIKISPTVDYSATMNGGVISDKL